MTASNYDDRRRERREAPKCHELPDLDAALREYEATIRSIAEACRERHVRPVFVYQPSVWKAGLSERGRALLWYFRMGDGRFLSVEKMREGMDAFNGALRKTCAELDVGFIDLGALAGREELFYDDCHFNEAGAREVARLMSGWFLRQESTHGTAVIGLAQGRRLAATRRGARFAQSRRLAATRRGVCFAGCFGVPGF
jgi:hypothetical protein